MFCKRTNDFLRKCFGVDVICDKLTRFSCLSLSSSSGISASCNLLRLICMPRTEGVFTKEMGGGVGWLERYREWKREGAVSLLHTGVHTHTHTQTLVLSSQVQTHTYTVFRYLFVFSVKDTLWCPGYGRPSQNYLYLKNISISTCRSNLQLQYEFSIKLAHTSY